MIVKLLLHLLTSFVTFILGLFPSVSLPSWIGSTSSYIHDAFAASGAWAYLLPLTALKNGFIFLLACYAIVVTIRVVRMLASFLTGGGGSVV